MKVQLPKGTNMCGQNYSTTDEIEVRESPIHGNGVFASKEYPAQSDVAYFEGDEIDHDTRHSVTLDGHKIEPTGLLKYLNRSCDPNCGFRGRILVTKRQVHAGQELTIDYRETEGNSITYHFTCNCRSANCRRRI